MTNPKSEIKPILLSEMNTIVDLKDYNKDDYIFSEKYPFSATAMIYVLQGMSKKLNFTLDEEFIDEMNMCTFGKLEELFERYRNDSNGTNDANVNNTP